ncbi:hypothetical protein CsSME_00029258 [Camellia sinensis var. sinensis]
MADHDGDQNEPVVEAVTEKIDGHDSSSSSDSDTEKKPSSASVVKTKIYRLFGREKPVHKVLGGGKPADVLLWRDKKISAMVLGSATAIWMLFELIEYHLLTLVCHILILALAFLFLWANASTFINKSPPQIPEVGISDDVVLGIASDLRIEFNRAHSVIAGLWVISVVGSWCNFLTLCYIAFVLLHTMPVLYERYEDRIDLFAEKALVEFKKQYAVFDAQVLSKIPRGPLSGKKVA